MKGNMDKRAKVTDFGSASIDDDRETGGTRRDVCVLYFASAADDVEGREMQGGDLCVIAFGVCERLGVASHLTWLDLMQRGFA